MKGITVSLKKHILYFFVSMAVFSILNLPSNWDLFCIGNAQLRISAIFPVPAGLIMGPAGALGCAAGNLFSDMFGNFSISSVFGCLANFLYAWIPYRLWHTLLPVENHKLKFVSSANTTVKFILITVFSTLASMAVLSAGCELVGSYGFFRLFVPTVMCNLFFSLFGGTTLFLVLTNLLNIKPYVPKKLYQNQYIHKRYIADYILCCLTLLLLLIKIIYTCLSFLKYNNGVSGDLLCSLSDFVNTYDINTFIYDILIIISVLSILFLPMCRSRKPVSGAVVSLPTGTELSSHTIVMFFICTSLCSIILFGVFEYLFISNAFLRSTDDSLYHMTLRTLFFINLFGVSVVSLICILLKKLEKSVIKPISSISEYCVNFVQNGLAYEIPDLEINSSEILQLASSCSKMASDIVKYVESVQEQAKKEEKARAMLEAAAKIQMGILPIPLQSESFEVYTYIKPAQTVGGDFYDFAQLDEDRLLVCIADVSSKGLPAAMFMAEANMVLKCNRQLSAEMILKKVNEILCDNNSENMFVTVFIGIINTKEKTLEFSNAGHNFPIFVNGGTTEFLKSKPEPPIGFFSDFNYSLHKTHLKDDFELLLYTDGVNEAENIKGEFFGNDRLLTLCKSDEYKSAPIESHIDILIKSVEKFTDGAMQSDDITTLTVRMK